MPKFRIDFQKLYSVVIEAEDEDSAEDIFNSEEYNARKVEYLNTEVVDIEEEN